MPRTGRVVIEGGTYHVLTRGNNGQQVFHHEDDYQRYLQLLSASAKEHRLAVHHFVLMPNHVHLILWVQEAGGLSRAMQHVNLRYALFYQRRYRHSGHLWQGRFKSLLIDQESSLLACGRYVELNPVRAGLINDPAQYPWSSYHAYATGRDHALIIKQPLYQAMGRSPAERQQAYRRFTMEGLRANDGHAHAEPFSFTYRRRKPGRPRKTVILGAAHP